MFKRWRDCCKCDGKIDWNRIKRSVDIESGVEFFEIQCNCGHNMGGFYDEALLEILKDWNK